MKRSLNPHLRLLVITLIMMSVISVPGCSRNGQPAENQGTVKAVKVITVTEKEQPGTLNYLGTVDAKELVKYSFKTPGQIGRIYVAEGESVAKGQKLAELDKTDLEFQLASAKATRDTAAANVTKAQNALEYASSLSEKTAELYKGGVVSEDAWAQIQLKRDTAASDLALANSQYANAQTDYDYKSTLLSNSTIYAEQAGYVVQKVFNENERVNAFTPIVIVRSGAQIVNIGVPQQELAQIKVGTQVNLAIDQEIAAGTISSISELPDETTRTYTAEITVPDKLFRLGSIAKVSVSIGSQNGIWIPFHAIFADGAENCVYVIKDERSFKRTVEILNVSEDKARVSGLTSGELLAISGMNNLDDGTRVQVLEQEQSDVQNN